MDFFDRIPYICMLVMVIACAIVLLTISACLLHAEFKPAPNYMRNELAI